MSIKSSTHRSSEDFPNGKKFKKFKKQIGRGASSCDNHININKLMIYVQNLSGAKSKIYQINNFLATTTYDSLCLQESWFNNTIDNNEIIASTNFHLHRMDRSSFLNKRGGIVTFIHNSIDFQIINIPKTALEIQAIRINLGNQFNIIINTCLPPYQYRTNMIIDFKTTINLMKTTYPSDQLLIIGDFNMSHTQWKYDNDIPGILFQTSITIRSFEHNFIDFCLKNCIYYSTIFQIR